VCASSDQRRCRGLAPFGQLDADVQRLGDHASSAPRENSRYPNFVEIGPLQKRCSRCGEVRPLGWYCRKDKGRLTSECRECRRAGKSRRDAVRRSRLKVGHERVTDEDIRQLGERQGWRCRHCGVSVRYAYDVDHIRPVSRGGAHSMRNLQLLCRRCNLVKGASWPST
jgi:5-methylcytosine-specific restriction endonuclease McrA